MTRLLLSILTVVIFWLMASSAVAQNSPEKFQMCVGTPPCAAFVTPICWGTGVTIEFAIDENVGCAAAATYSVEGANISAGNWHNIITLSQNGVTSFTQQISGKWFGFFRVIPSSTTGCTDLEINLFIHGKV